MEQRSELVRLDRQRREIESEMETLRHALAATNMGGTKAPLVDNHGYPRADIDVHQTAIARNRLACLNTDHTNLMKDIERKLYLLHQTTTHHPNLLHQPAHHPTAATASAAAAAAARPPTGATRIASTAPTSFAESCQPFATIDSVATGGPAQGAGVVVGDEIVRFGSVHHENHCGLRALSQLTQRSEDSTVSVTVRRRDASGSASLVELSLVPRRWEGPGLLGCHLVPL
jgi:26S proteasome non-ATPase regulatory subunit 9